MMAVHKSKLGPIPPENYDNDPPFLTPEEVEKVAGNVLDHLRKKRQKPTEDRSEKREFNEAEHPRDEGGKFTDAGGGDGEGGKDEGAAAPAAAPAHDPEVVNVGGDEWNKETAVKLETEYAAARAAIEKIAKEVEKTDTTVNVEEEESYEPDSWDTMSGDQQTAAEEHFIENKLEAEVEWAKTNYYNDGAAVDDAAYKTAYDFNEDQEWVKDAMKELHENESERMPFSDAEILAAIAIDYEQGTGKVEPTITIDNSKLPREQTESLPGIDAGNPLAGLLTQQMREDIIDTLTDAFKQEAEKQSTYMTPPDYLEDNAKESVEMAWDNQSDDAKYEYAKDSGIVGDDVVVPTEVEVTIPDSFDPLNVTQGRNYRETQALARHMSIERAVDVFSDRKIAIAGRTDYSDALISANLRTADNRLWEGWKDSSTGKDGLVLQLAIATELGGRYNEERGGSYTPEKIKEFAAERYSSIGGWKGVLAYVRAKWETTQYLLEKANIKTLDLYRAVGKDPEEIRAEPQELVEGTYKKMTDVEFLRNGAASFSVSRDVPNNWKQDDVRVVIRASVPRTAVISVPAYGINIHSEREVVLAGTAWKSWDAWAKKAPDFQSVPLAMAA
jgi:hypothetical protein